MRISDWSSDVCSSDLELRVREAELVLHRLEHHGEDHAVHIVEEAHHRQQGNGEYGGSSAIGRRALSARQFSHPHTPLPRSFVAGSAAILGIADGTIQVILASVLIPASESRIKNGREGYGRRKCGN